MSRIPTPATISAAPEASQSLLESVNAQLGSVPNLFRLVSNSPAVLEGYLGLSAALGKGELDSQTRERVALAIAEINGCDYCLAAHSYLGTNVAKLSESEIATNRKGSSLDEKAAVAVKFVVAIAKSRGQVSDDTVEEVRNVGFSDAEIVELIAHVALNTLTNYINEVLDTTVDFPAALPISA